MTRGAHRQTSRPGFTLLELLAVIAIIVILAGLIVFAAPAIFTGQQKNQTEATLTALERVLEEYRLARGQFPRYDEDRVERYEEVFGADDGGSDTLQAGPILPYQGQDHAARPDAYMFVSQVAGFGNVNDLLGSIPGDVTRSKLVPDPDAGGTDLVVQQFIDAWDNPILFVHPDNELAQDLFGRCQNGRPYFMSAGPDGRYGFASETVAANSDEAEEEDIEREMLQALEDNIYSTEPGLRRDDQVEAIRRAN
jgi:prepilin-type N-terminal cleavage/methylation domain-containing protein